MAAARRRRGGNEAVGLPFGRKGRRGLGAANLCGGVPTAAGGQAVLRPYPQPFKL